MVPPLLNINPSQVEFMFEADKELKAAMNIRNVHDNIRAAYKIKTTNLERFVVSPPFGIVEPGTTKLVKVYMRGSNAYTDEFKFCKDCFLVQSIAVDNAMTEEHITSALFKGQDRQEAKMKVLVAAPLAHGKMLEHEIKDIASNQGVEGHRAVARKFAELLMAKGIISQAQVALAFSIVGELFQDLQDQVSQAGENAGENFRKSNSQLFLEGRTGLMTEMNPGSSGSGFNEWSMPQSRRYDASKAATFKSLQSMNGRISPSRSFPNYHGRANGNAGDSIISALTHSTEQAPTSWLRRTPDLRSLGSAPTMRGPPSVDDKAEVGSLRTAVAAPPVRRLLSYDDEAVNKAFPDEMFSQQLANGMNNHTSSSSGSTPMARERQSAFRPSLDEKLDAALDYGAEPNPLFSIPYSSMDGAHYSAASAPAERNPFNSRRVSTSQLYGPQPSFPKPRETPPTASTLDHTEKAVSRRDQSLLALPAPLLPVEAAEVKRDANGASASASASGAEIQEFKPSIAEARTSDTSRGHMDGVGTAAEPSARGPIGNGLANGVAGEGAIVADESERGVHNSPSTESSHSPASQDTQEKEELRGTEGQNAGKSPDSMGRTDAVTIDRLATPAIRKTAPSPGKRIEGVVSPAKKQPESTNLTAESASVHIVPATKVVSPMGKAGDKGHVNEPPDFSHLHLDIRDKDAGRGYHENGLASPGSPTDVAIPSGNTMKMATFWDARIVS